MAPKKEAQTNSFAINDLVLGRIKGFPAWPAKIVNPDTEYVLPEVLAARKKNAFLIRFYADATYTWSTSAELKPLTAETIDAYLKRNDKGGKGAKGGLLVAYKTAQDPQQWEADHAANMEQLRANPPPEEEESDAEAKTGAKRKSTRKAGGSTVKKAKTEKKETNKSKAKDKKNDGLEEGLKKSKEWRHKLQRGFLGSALPKPDDMPDFDKVFAEMEATTFKSEWLAETKLPKVLRRIYALDGIPRDAEFKIKQRAGDLMEAWKTLIPEAQPSGEGASPTTATQPEAETAAPAEALASAAPVEDGDLTVLDQSIVVDEKEVNGAPAPPATEEPRVNGDAAKTAPPS